MGTGDPLKKKKKASPKNEILTHFNFLLTLSIFAHRESIPDPALLHLLLGLALKKNPKMHKKWVQFQDCDMDRSFCAFSFDGFLYVATL